MQRRNTTNLRMLPIRDDAIIEAVAYSQWIRSQDEDKETYVRRRKVIDLAQIVQDVISEELTPGQRQAVLLRFYENCSVQQIAEQMQISSSSATKYLLRAQEQIHRAVKYVVRYQYDMRNMEILPCAVREALVTASGRYGRGKDVGDRLRRLREGEHLSVACVSAGTKIEPDRLLSLESGAQTPDCAELLRLSAYFAVSTDRILKGVSA